MAMNAPRSKSATSTTEAQSNHGRETMRTIKTLAQESLDVQDACNLCAVAQGFARCMSDLLKHDLGGTDATNTHPIALLWADKIAHLTGTQTLGGEAMMQAYERVSELIG